MYAANTTQTPSGVFFIILFYLGQLVIDRGREIIITVISILVRIKYCIVYLYKHGGLKKK